MSSRMASTEFNGPSLPLLASGEFSGFRWEFRGDIIGDSAHEWAFLHGPHGGGGGGGIGPLPFADLGWMTIGHITGIGEASAEYRRGWFRRVRSPVLLYGVAARSVARLRVCFEGREPADAILVPTDHPDVQFFYLVLPARTRWSSAVALSTEGVELNQVTPSR